MKSLTLLSFLIGFGLAPSAQALEFHPTQSMTLDWAEPGTYQFDSFTIPVGVTVSLPGVDASLAAPTAYFTITGDVVLEGALLAPGWDVTMDFNGNFVSTPASRIQSYSLALHSLGPGTLQVGGVINAGSSSSGTTPMDTVAGRTGDATGNAGGVTLQAGGDISLGGPSIAGAVSASNGGQITLLPGGELTAVRELNTSILVASGDALVIMPTGVSGNENLTLSAPVPEPKTYAMLIASLGLIGYVVRKRA